MAVSNIFVKMLDVISYSGWEDWCLFRSISVYGSPGTCRPLTCGLLAAQRRGPSMTLPRLQASPGKEFVTNQA